MDKSDRYSTPSRIPKASGIPRPRSKSTDRDGHGSPSNSGTRSKSVPREVSDMSERERHTHERYQSSQEEEYYDHNDPPSPRHVPNSIPRYQYSASKYRPGILVNHPPQSDALSTKTDFSNVFRNKPDYSMMGSHIPATEDVSSMFQRPNTVIPSVNSGWGNKDGGKGYSPGEKDYQPIMSPNNNSTIGFKSSYSTAEELDNLLAKYKALPQSSPPPMEIDYQVFQNTVYATYPMETNYHNIPKPKHYERIKKFVEPPQTAPNEKLGVFGLPLDSNYNKQHNKQSSSKKIDDVGSKSKGNLKHLFPFKESAEGDLFVHPDQIAFESHTITVLVSDPSKIWSVKSEKLKDLRNQDNLVKEIEDVIYKGLNRFYDGHSVDFGKEDDTRKKNIENEYLNKEMVTVKYSDSKAGTDKLMLDIHNRLRSGRHADTHIMIANKIYPCHSVALECVSKFFDNLSRSRDTLRRIELPDSEVPAMVFPTLMDWILQNDHGRAATMNKSNVVPLFSCGKYLDISELKSQCVNYLHEKVETNDRHLMNLWEEVKKRPNCHELMVVIAAKAALSFQHIFKERKFLNLDVDELVMLLSSDDIVIESELDVFNTAVQWLLHSWDNRKIFTNEVINTVRFGLLTALQLTQIAHSPELSNGATSVSKEYPELLAYGSVKAMIDDGLAYSIVNESYKTQPEEIKKWVNFTGVKAPRPRNHTNPTSRTKIFMLPHDLTDAKHLDQLNRRPSYTIFKKDAPLDTFSNSSSSNPKSQDSPHKHSVLSMFDSPGTHNNKHEQPRGTTLESLADSLGSPIRDEAIQSLGPDRRPRSASAGSSGRSRSNSRERDHSRDKYSSNNYH